MVAEFAPAKINLALHVTGQRADGYHLLDSLVVFADVGDNISVTASDQLELSLFGPQASTLPTGPDNLVLKAAALMARQLACARGAAIVLEKNLPVASGIGGGSADAAACLRALARHWNCPLPAPDAVLRLGADVPVCLAGQPCRMRGVGDRIEALRGVLPPAWLVLVNPGIAVSTPDVFRALAQHDNPPLPDHFPNFPTVAALAAFLRQNRNDLEPAATALAPEIATVSQALTAQKGCLLSRMSGSGATCFGLFATQTEAQQAANALQAAQPGWWIAAAKMRAT